MTLDTCSRSPATPMPARHVPSTVEALREIDRAAMTGATICWIRPTAEEALEAAGLLRVGGLNPILLHAGPSAETRSAFAAAKSRACAQVLVATPDVAPLLDLNCDLVISDIAPTDLALLCGGTAEPLDAPPHQDAETRQVEPALV